MTTLLIEDGAVRTTLDWLKIGIRDLANMVMSLQVP
jgi:hypothetical protein